MSVEAFALHSGTVVDYLREGQSMIWLDKDGVPVERERCLADHYVVEDAYGREHLVLPEFIDRFIPSLEPTLWDDPPRPELEESS